MIYSVWDRIRKRLARRTPEGTLDRSDALPSRRCAHEIETLIITILGQPNADNPSVMAGIAEAWNKLDKAIQRILLPTILRRVIWHHADQEISIDLLDIAGRRINVETAPDEDQELA